jgi:hypothetical protein
VFQNNSATNVVHPFSSTPARSFLAFSNRFIGGGTVALADMNLAAGGKDEILVASGSGMSPAIAVYDVQKAATKYNPIKQYSAFNAGFHGGVSLSVGRIDNDLIPDLIVSAGAAGGSQIEVRSGATGALLQNSLTPFTAVTQKSLVRAVAKDVNGDGIIDAIYAAQGADNRTHTIRRYQPLSSAAIDYILENSVDFAGGYFIG